MCLKTNKRTKVFICYSHQHVKWLTRLQYHLKVVEDKVSIDFWDDTKIIPGEKWRSKIEAALESARVAILFVSSEFLASDFISKYELPTLLKAAEKGGVRILPVLINPCIYQNSGLEDFQFVNNPSCPLEKMSKFDREEVFVKVAKTFLEEKPESRQRNIEASNYKEMRILEETSLPNKSSQYVDYSRFNEEVRDDIHIKIISINIVSFSKRQAANTQRYLINKFTELVRVTLESTLALFVRNSNLSKSKEEIHGETIKSPAGDGMVIIFVSNVPSAILLDYPVKFLKALHEHNKSIDKRNIKSNRDKNCEFKEKGYCKCHEKKFMVRIGVNEGNAVPYTDINGMLNTVGKSINSCAKIMALGDGMQILMTDNAYLSLKNVRGNEVDTLFKIYNSVKTKHDEDITIYQYTPKNCPFINTETPKKIEKYFNQEILKTISETF